MAGAQPPEPGGRVYLNALETFFESFYQNNKALIDLNSKDKLNCETILKLKSSEVNSVNNSVNNISENCEINNLMYEVMDASPNYSSSDDKTKPEDLASTSKQIMHTQGQNQNNQEWTQVTSNKRKNIASPNRRIKQKTDLITNTHNRFQALENIYDVTVTNNQTEKKKERNPNPPPIFIPNVVQFQTLTETLDCVGKNKFQCKLIAGDQVKVQFADIETYRKGVTLLQEKQTDFHTYQIKQEKNYRVVLKNIHHSVEENELKQEIEEYGHTVKNIYNIKHRINKTPLPLFFVDIAPAPNNKDIYNITELANTKIIIEPPRPKREIVQCARCQRYSHTKAYCFRQLRCVVVWKKPLNQTMPKRQSNCCLLRLM